MKLYLCPANQVFQDIALSAMDYYYETSILSINGTGQSAFGDNYFDIPTTQIEVEIDDAEYIEIMAADRDHTLGMWWQLGAIITDDNDVRLFIGLIKNDSLKHTPTDNRFGFEVLDLLGSLIAGVDKTKKDFEPKFVKNTGSPPLIYFTYGTDFENIDTAFLANIADMISKVEIDLGAGALSGVLTTGLLASGGLAVPIQTYFNDSGEIPETTDEHGTLIDFPYYTEGIPFDEWSASFMQSGHVLKAVERFIADTRVKYVVNNTTTVTSPTTPTAIEIRVYRFNNAHGFATVYISQFNKACPIVCMGSQRVYLTYDDINNSSDPEVSHSFAMYNLGQKLKAIFTGIDDKIDIMTLGINNSDDALYDGILGVYTEEDESNWQTLYTFNRNYIRRSAPNFQASYLMVCSFATSTKPAIEVYGSGYTLNSMHNSGNYNDPATNIKDLTVISNRTIQAKNNTIYIKNKININEVEIGGTEDIFAITDSMLSDISINGIINKYDGVDLSCDVLFYAPKYENDKSNKSPLASALDKSYGNVFNAYNVKLLADLIGYYEFTAGQAISYQGKYYRVFAWEYDESSGTTSIDAYGRK